MSGSKPQGTVIADIAHSRAEIEAARLLVLSAALQVNPSNFASIFANIHLQIDKYKAKGALKEIGIAKVTISH
jgi:acyl-CoA dehydrogenase